MTEIFTLADVEARVAPFDWSFRRDRSAEIDAYWDARLAVSPRMYNGEVLLMHEVEARADALRCQTFVTDFKSFLSWKDWGFPGEPVFNCFGMAALRAADGAFLLGEMNTGTSTAGRLYFPAGTPEPADLDATGRLDFTANILRELEEETGLAAADIEMAEGWTIVRERGFVACMRDVRVPLDSAAVCARIDTFNARQEHPELKGLCPVRSPADYDGARMPRFMIDYLDYALARA